MSPPAEHKRGLEKWNNSNLVEFNGQQKPHAPAQAGGQLTGKQLCQEGPGGPVGHQVDQDQQRAFAAKTDGRLREGILPLCSALERHSWTSGCSAGLPVQERHGLTGVCPVKAHKDEGDI